MGEEVRRSQRLQLNKKRKDVVLKRRKKGRRTRINKKREKKAKVWEKI